MKQIISIAIDTELLENFGRMLDERMISRSKMVSVLIEQEIENYTR